MGTTPNYSLPYPEGTDYVAQGAAAIEALADALELLALPVVCTSATRPATPIDGALIYETDTLRLLEWTGAAWSIVTEPPQAWTVTQITQGVAVNVTTDIGWFQRSRGVVTGQLSLTINGAGTNGQLVTVPNPVTLTAAGALGGSFAYQDVSVGLYAGSLFPAATGFVMTRDGFANHLGSTFAVASGDGLRATFYGRYA